MHRRQQKRMNASMRGDDLALTDSFYFAEQALSAAQEDFNRNTQVGSKSTLNEPTVTEIAKLSYKGFVVRIFTDNHYRMDARRFYYFEPIVQLDPSSIISESNELLNENLVRFTIKMWDPAIRSKVLDRLRSLPSLKNLDIQQDDVHVMPYEEVQLIVKPGSSIFKSAVSRLVDDPLCYRRLNENLDFELECNSSSEADILVENLKKNPELILKKWKLAIECRGLVLGIGASKVDNPCSFIFNVSTLPAACYENEVSLPLNPRDGLLPQLTDSNQAMILRVHGFSNEINSNTQDIEAKIKKEDLDTTDVFWVEYCINREAAHGESLGFRQFIDVCFTESRRIESALTGHFDLPSGIFTVKRPGNYRFSFYGRVQLTASSLSHRFDLKVNGETVATSLAHSPVETKGFEQVSIVVLLPLKTGDRVGIFVHRHGKLYENIVNNPPYYVTRFHGTLISDQPKNPLLEYLKTCLPALPLCLLVAFIFFALGLAVRDIQFALNHTVMYYGNSKYKCEKY